ncbi:MAG: hypothetical protein GXP51_05540, partial [Deltaproteobacteria bacterium]|nr:hypothetical protein [Deltaproteobacteria bacterium]
MSPDSLEGFSRNLPTHRRRLKTSGEDWVRRILIILGCIWLLVGVVLPLREVLNRATHVEFIVKVEEPTEAEKLEDPFRGQIDVAGHSIILTREETGPAVYFDNKRLVLINNRAHFGPVAISISADRLEKVVYSPTGTLSIAPLIIERSPKQHWTIDGSPLAGKVTTIQRFIGLQNFFDYFGIKGLSQAGTLGLLVYISLTLTLSGFLLYSLVRPIMPGNRHGILTFAGLLLMGVQAVISINYLGNHIVDSNLARAVLNSLEVAICSTGIAVALAFAYAYGINRTCMPGKGFYRLIAMLPLFAPTMLYGLSLVYLFGNKGVITTGFFEKLPWLAWDIGLYGFTGVVIAEVVFTFPPAFM